MNEKPQPLSKALVRGWSWLKTNRMLETLVISGLKTTFLFYSNLLAGNVEFGILWVDFYLLKMEDKGRRKGWEVHL